MVVIVTCLIALAGAWTGKKLRLPSGIIIGSIVAVAAANLTFGVEEIPNGMKLSTQVVAGAFVGVGLDRESLKRLYKLIKPACIIVGTLVTANITLGILLYLVSPLDLGTSLFATVPGGLAEMSVIAEDLGTNPAVVSVFHLARLIVSVCVFPLVITHIMKAEKCQPEDRPAYGKTVPSKTPRSFRTLTPKQWKEFLLTVVCATVGGIIGIRIGMPGGALLFSAIACAVLKICFDTGMLPKWAKQLAQVIVGAYVGAKVTPDVVLSILDIWPYILMVVSIYLVICLSAGWVISKTSNLDKATAAFASAPAGASDMALIASDYQVDPPAIAVLQMIRLVMVIAISPSLITIILKLQSIYGF